jgi:hypothetical protein
MKANIITTVLFVAFLLSLASVSALSNPTLSLSSSVLTKSTNTTVLTVTNPASSDSADVSFVLPTGVSVNSTTFNLANGTSRQVLLTLDTLPTNSVSQTVNVTFTNSTNTTSSTISYNYVKSFCAYGSQGNETRNLQIVTIKDLTSENDWEWKPQDEVDVEVKVEYTNQNDDDDEIDAIIELKLWDSVDKQFVEFENQDDLDDRDVTLEEGDSYREVFTVIVPTEDMEDSASRYQLYVKVYEDGKESTLCRDDLGSGATPSNDITEYYKSIELTRESYEVSIKNLQVNTPVVCNGEVTITGTAWNIGTNDEDKVYINAFNSALKASVNTSVFPLDTGESKKFTLSFIVPENVTESTYDIYLSAYYKYSKSSEEYRDFTEDPYKVTIKVEGCNIPKKNATIATELVSDKAIIGENVNIKATVKNTGNVASTYTLQVVNAAWASEVTMVPSDAFTLQAGEEKAVDLWFAVKSDALAGEQSFKIRAVSDNQVINEVTVQGLTLEKGITTSIVLNHLKNNWVIYTIVLVNLILIIAIILVIRSIVRK